MDETENPQPPNNQPTKVYSVPRRFGIGTILGVATAYALLLWGMQQLDWPPAVIIINAIFLTAIGAMQVVMTNTPRWASIIVGELCTLSVFGIMTFDDLIVSDFVTIAAIFAIALICGLIYGYLGGALVAGVFLVIDAVAKYFLRNDRAGRPGSQ